jgi:single-stranded-DNA-specific exonuclease
MAAGFTVATDKLEQVQKKLISLANQQLTEEDLQPKIKIDLELDFSSLTLELYQAIKKLEPFGLGNYQPVFLTRGLRVIDARTVGATGKHLKLNLADWENSGSSAVIGAIGFGMGDLYQKLSPETEVDLVYTLEMDEWDGNKKLQLKVKDIKLI